MSPSQTDTGNTMTHSIDFEPIGRRGEIPAGSSLLDAARRLGVGLLNVCGGHGSCGNCKLQVLQGAVSETTAKEKNLFSPQELKQGWRLACCTSPEGPCRVHVPAESMTTTQRIQLEGRETPFTPSPSVKMFQVQLPEPSFSDPRADAARLMDTLLKQHAIPCDCIDIDVLRDLSPKLRSWHWKAGIAVRGTELIAVRPPGQKALGLAVDLGTTKLAGYLVDLESGKTLAAAGIMNPQISYGEDITSRMSNAMKLPDGAMLLRKLTEDGLNHLAAELCAQAQAAPEDILDAVIVANTAIHHLLLGLPVRQLVLSPFLATASHALDIKARDMGLSLAPGAYVHILPNIAGFVGADHVAMLLAVDAPTLKKTTISLDIGTNTEISLIKDGNITSVSCASGPAFEGGHIKYGMRAAGGAIEKIRIDPDGIVYQTVDGAPPVGLCGSGIIDAAAQGFLAGLIDEGGRIRTGHALVLNQPDGLEILLAGKESGSDAITLTQRDIREIQLAKAAIRAGIQLLLESQGCTEEEIGQIIIAGAFGTYIDVASAVTIGMLPSLPLDRFKQVGNAAGAGARMALLSKEKREEAKHLAAKTNYLELATAANFNRTFAQANYLGKFKLREGKREKIAAA